MTSLRPTLNRIFALVVALAFASAPLAPALLAQSPPPRRDPQALALLAQSSARAGVVSESQVVDTVMRAAVSYGDGSLHPEVVIRTLGSDRLRLDNDDGTSSISNRGRRAYLRGGAWQGYQDPNARNQRIEHLPTALLTYELARPDISAEYVGLEKVNGRDAHRLRLSRISSRGRDIDSKLTKDSELEVWIDSSAFDVLKIAFVYLSATDWRRGLPVEIQYDDYRAVSGLRVPFLQRKLFNGAFLHEL